MNIIRWGIIGCGNVAENKSGAAFYRTSGSELIAVMRRDAKKAEEFARRHNVRRWYGDVESLINDPEVNAIYIASPHHLHQTHVELATQKHKVILCEKPMGVSLAEARAIVNVCRHNGASLTVAYYRRFWAITQKMIELLRGGAIGEVVQARVQLADYFAGDPNRSWLTAREKSGGGALANAGSHWVDLIRFLFGDVNEAAAFCAASRFEVDDTVGAQLRMKSGALVSLNITLQSPINFNEIDISGTEGRMMIHSLSDGHLTLHRRGKEPEEMRFTRDVATHTELITELIARWKKNEPSPIAGEEAAAAWKVMDAIYRACEEHQTITV